MRIKPDADLKAFMLSVNNCKQDVLFITEEGDQLNLKSELSRYLFAAVVNHPHILESGSLQFKDPADMDILSPYITKT